MKSPEPQENDQKTVVEKTIKNSATKPYFSDFEAKLSQRGMRILRADALQHPSLFQPFSTLMPGGVIFDPRAQMLEEWTPQTKHTKSKKHHHSVLFFMASANEIHRQSTGNQRTREPGNQETKVPGNQGTRELAKQGTRDTAKQGSAEIGNQRHSEQTDLQT